MMNRFILLICSVGSLLTPIFLFTAEENKPNVSDYWLKEALKNIQEEEYKPSLQEFDYNGKEFTSPKYHFVNRVNNLRAYIDESGMELMARVIPDEESWNLKIKSIEISSRKDEKIFSDLEVTIDGDNIKYTGKSIEIAYSNSESGIEQNISIQKSTEAQGNLLVDFIIEMENLKISSEKDRFILSGKENEIIYQIKKIEDSTGKEILYSLRGEEGELNILLDGNDVVYPIKIITNIFSSNSSVENLSVSLSAKDIGLNETANWFAESDQVYANLGYSVSSAGDVNGDGYSDVIVGAPYYDNGQSDEGAAFLYRGSSGGLDTVPVWTAESDQDDASFGFSVSSAGDVNGDGYSDVIVGAILYDSLQSNEGRAFVYHGNSSGLSRSPKWTAECDLEGACFGCSVSSAGDVNGDGYSDAIVGAYSYFDNEKILGGRVFVYHGSSSGLSATPNWTAESTQFMEYFGRSVSSAGDVNGDGYSDVIVAAPFYGQVYEGMTFVYHGSSSGLSATPNWTAEGNQASAHFGESVSSAGDVNGDGYSDVIVGAFLLTIDTPELNYGEVFVYYGSSGGLPYSADWTAECDQDDACFGCSVSSAGDVNGDGYSDVIVGAYGYDHGQLAEGRAFVYHGNSSGLSTSPTWTAEGNQLMAFFGHAVSSAGDVNGDGYSDVIVGAYGYDYGQADEGMAFVYHGSLSGIEDYPNEGAKVKLSVFPSISTNIFSISFYISEEEAEKEISLKVYNKAGIMVKNLFTGNKSAGTHLVTWNGKSNMDEALPNDVYFISLKKGTEKNTVKKIVLLR